MQNLPQYLIFIGPTFLQDHCTSDDLTKIRKALKSTVKGGNEILYKLIDEPSMAQNLKVLVQQDHENADVKDMDGKRAIDRAPPQCMAAMKEGLYLLQECDVISGPLFHSSRTACVFKVNRFIKQEPVTGKNNKENEWRKEFVLMKHT